MASFQYVSIRGVRPSPELGIWYSLLPESELTDALAIITVL
jgi:hypothetical protein